MIYRCAFQRGRSFGTTPNKEGNMIRVVYKRRHNGKRTPPALVEAPNQWRQFVTYEHSVERWHA